MGDYLCIKCDVKISILTIHLIQTSDESTCNIISNIKLNNIYYYNQSTKKFKMHYRLFFDAYIAYFTQIYWNDDIEVENEYWYECQIRKFHNYIYANDDLSDQEVLEEILKIFYIKSFDELNENMLQSLTSETEMHSKMNQIFNKLKKKYPSRFKKNIELPLKPETLFLQ